MSINCCIMHNTESAPRPGGKPFALDWRFLVLSVFLRSGFIIFMSPLPFNRLRAVRREGKAVSISCCVGDEFLLPLCCGYFEDRFPSLLESCVSEI